MSLHASSALSLGQHPPTTTQLLQSLGVTTWLRPGGAAAGATFSEPDVMGAAGPAVQATAARQPTIATASNGVTVLTHADDFLDLTIVPSFNGATSWAIGFWLSATFDATVRWLFSMARVAQNGGSSADKLVVAYQSARGVMFDLYASDGQGYRARSDTTGTGYNFWTCQYNGALGTDALRAVITKNAAALTCSFEAAAGAQASIPTSLPQPTGSAYLGSKAAGGSPTVGSIGHVFLGTRGWTVSEIAQLMTIEPPA